MFTLATATATVVRYASATAAQDLHLARAIEFLSVEKKKSVRDIAGLTTHLSKPIGKTRVGVILKTIKAAPADVTADDFRTLLQGATAANTGERVAAPTVTADTSETEGDTFLDGKGKRVPSGDVTVDPTVLLADLALRYGSNAAFRQAVIDLSNEYAPVVLVATPVAA